ncbi:hypothetical protein [Sphingomonas sp. Root241]|uniref:hypothetical protein n=1 Tax=Sphingomonas sp. Root241 TaxID=1736501 RepID=UPI0006F51752|nr:hypothetical protein [Sphingomonas sp. Root241]KRC82433.1 hypothetical protein ASE13_09125 [Sphingomonas sp. Root241]
MNIPVALLSLLSSLDTPAVAEAWEWRGAAAVIDVDLVRADIRIIVKDGPSEVRIVPRGDDAASVTFSAASAGDVVRIRDRYLPRARWPNDCLPPVDERGDYWTHMVPLQVTIQVPPESHLRVRVISGNIHTSAVSAGFDLKSRDGMVQR